MGTYNLNKLILFSFDLELGLIVEYKGSKKTSFYELELLEYTRQTLVKYLVDIINKMSSLNISNGKSFGDSDVLILGCNCIGGINEHNIIISKIDSSFFLKFNLSCNSKTDGILLGKEQVEKLLDFLL